MHVTHMNESCLIHESWAWWGFGPCWQIPKTTRFGNTGPTHMKESCHTLEQVTSHMWMSHVTHMNVTQMNEFCHTDEGVMSHIWMSHVTHMNESCHTYEWVMSHIWTSHVTHRNESCHTYEWVMSHIWMSHNKQSHMTESCHSFEWVITNNDNNNVIANKTNITNITTKS
jgi:hypothetical protein